MYPCQSLLTTVVSSSITKERIINGYLTQCTDKKNENKKVAVNEFLPTSTAVEAIQYSMCVRPKLSFNFEADWAILFVYDNFQPTELFFNWQGPLCRVHYAFPEAIGELYIPPIVFQLGGGGMEIHHLNKSFHLCYLLSTMFDDDVTSIFCTCTLSVSFENCFKLFSFQPELLGL